MIKMTLSDAAKILACPAPATDAPFEGVAHNTKTLVPGNLFFALPGERFDGHDFIIEARAKGAAAAIVNRALDAPIAQLIVNDTIQALGLLSANWRDRFTLPLIGVTGSNGKTTLKNMIASIFTIACQSASELVFSTKGNLNNHIGLPMTLFQLGFQHRYGVLEMGMNHFGEIAYLTQLAKPTVAVINNAAESHLEGVKSVYGVAQAKGEIFQGLRKDGTAILNRDDAHFDYWRTLVDGKNCLSFGLSPKADISASKGELPNITVHTPTGKFTVDLPLLGTHNIMNALAATAATLAVGIDLNAIQAGLEQISPAPGRMQPHLLANGARVIDDTYNANPFSLQAAVNAIQHFNGKKIVVLGDMKELGDDAEGLHYQAGEKMREAGIDYLFTFGQLSAATSEAFGNNSAHFQEQEALIQALSPHIKAAVTVLIKGSRSMKMEKILQALLPPY